MSLGKAAVYKHIPIYYPEHVGAVGGIVGLIGGLGGFILPISFGVMNDVIGVWTSCFMLLFAITAVALIWMHASILHMEGKLEKPKFLPELKLFNSKSQAVDKVAARKQVAVDKNLEFKHEGLEDWDPENEKQWNAFGKKIAYRNLWISIPSLLCGFAVWLYWGIITVQMLNLALVLIRAIYSR